MTSREIVAALSETLMGFAPMPPLTEADRLLIEGLRNDPRALQHPEPRDVDGAQTTRLLARANARRHAYRVEVTEELRNAGWRVEPIGFEENAARDRWEWSWSVDRDTYSTSVTVAASRSAIASTEYDSSPTELVLASAGLSAIRRHLIERSPGGQFASDGPAPVIDDCGNTLTGG